MGTMKTDLIKITYRSELIGIRTFKTKYTAEILHKGLNDFKVFSDYDNYILKNKVDVHVAKLEEKWENIVNKQNAV